MHNAVSESPAKDAMMPLLPSAPSFVQLLHLEAAKDAQAAC